jgi:hypothetical protein
MTKGSMELRAAISHCVARARAHVVRQKRLAPFADVEHNGSGFEEDQAVFLENRYLPEGLQRAIVRFVLIALFEEARLVRQTGFLQRPARAQIAHLALGEIWNPFESRDRDHVVYSLAIA